jgi:RNA polymerase sigma-70 factor (ECF subfamily)
MTSQPLTLCAKAANSDLELLRRVAQKDRAAFEQLYVAYHRRLSRFLMRVVGRYNLVEEVVNDTLLVVWQKAGEFRADSEVSTWIVGIAYRRALKSLDHLGVQQRAEARSLEDALDDLQHSAEQVAQRESRDWLAKGLAQLPMDQRLTLELAYFLGHSCEEIATITGCPVNTVKSRLFQARGKLKALLPELARPQSTPGTGSTR